MQNQIQFRSYTGRVSVPSIHQSTDHSVIYIQEAKEMRQENAGVQHFWTVAAQNDNARYALQIDEKSRNSKANFQMCSLAQRQ
jgi:hypothetical protein